ncbi:hypothetical protein Pla22_28810 [Rubripirellula amarantea]|uniref:Uncharacterized protein n=1 Tax=Rubripirellula amarantea TaxID=2527999 RepID=A0A5C5WJE1_9BACT|nr:hypothetical protein Pla22_28810 [Rubripirellula amarantea]
MRDCERITFAVRVVAQDVKVDGPVFGDSEGTGVIHGKDRIVHRCDR